MFTKPVLYYQNALRDAQAGDDGMVYASCALTVPYLGDSNKLLGEITMPPDVAALSGLNGLQCVFDATKNKYHIVNIPTYPSIPSGIYRGIAYNGSVFVAVGDSTIAATSTDGITWTARTIPSGSYKAVAWNGSLFAAVGINVAATSLDGIVWTARTIPAGTYYGVAWSGSIFAAVGASVAATSPDGITNWVSRTIPAGTYYGVAWGSSIFAAVGASVAATSPDGITNWVSRTIPAGTYYGVAWGSSIFAAVGASVAATSPDGVTAWVARNIPPYTYYGVAWVGSFFEAVGVSVAATSPNGITIWSGCPIPTGTYYGVVWTGAIFAIVGDNAAGMSPNGSYWPKNILTLFERLQIIDIGTSFTIRDGLTCAQTDPTRPVMYAADGHLSPRMKGTVNTALYLRAHAPNFIEDGGFESGSFGSNWVAGGGWLIDHTNALEGYYAARWDTAANNNLKQSRTNKLKKGKTYRCIIKTKALTGNAAANCLTISLKQAGSGTNIYAAISGNAIAPTTTATWTEFDVIPDFTTDNWELWLVPLLANKGSATAIIVDEIYVYEKRTIDAMLLSRHNWGGKGAITVNAWRVSPLRSTAAADANNKTQIGSFSIDTSDNLAQALTSSVYPIYEIILPAVSSWTPEMGDILLGSGLTFPKWNQGPFDPYRTGKDKLIEFTLDFKNLSPTLRKPTIEDLFEKFRNSEAVWVSWNAEAPLLMESKAGALEAPYNPTRIDMKIDLIERL